MSLSTIANLIRLRSFTPAGEPAQLSPRSGARERTLLAREERPVWTPPVTPGRTDEKRALLVGLDFGASQTRVAALMPGIEEFYLRRSFPSAVARLVPEDEKTISPYLHFGDAALNKGPRFKTICPWQAGDIADPVMARELARHVRDLMRRSDALECQAVVAEPVTMSAEGRHHFRQALRGLFEQVVFLPRPYLAGLGLRQHLRNDPNFPSDDRPLLLVDLGAGSTEICRVGERYPQPGEMAGVAFGGAQVDQLMREALRQEYPAFQPSDALLRSWRENFGFVGEPGSTVVVNVPIDGVERQIVLTNALRRSCEVWLAHARQMIESLKLGGTGEGVRPTHVYLTGGGSRINRLVPVLNESLERGGICGLKVQLIEEADLSLAALGALYAAGRVRDDQWPRFTLA